MKKCLKWCLTRSVSFTIQTVCQLSYLNNYVGHSPHKYLLTLFPSTCRILSPVLFLIWHNMIKYFQACAVFFLTYVELHFISHSISFGKIRHTFDKHIKIPIKGQRSVFAPFIYTLHSINVHLLLLLKGLLYIIKTFLDIYLHFQIKQKEALKV